MDVHFRILMYPSDGNNVAPVSSAAFLRALYRIKRVWRLTYYLHGGTVRFGTASCESW
jgi:hypothetical protein